MTGPQWIFWGFSVIVALMVGIQVGLLFRHR